MSDVPADHLRFGKAGYEVITPGRREIGLARQLQRPGNRIPTTAAWEWITGAARHQRRNRQTRFS